MSLAADSRASWERAQRQNAAAEQADRAKTEARSAMLQLHRMDRQASKERVGAADFTTLSRANFLSDRIRFSDDDDATPIRQQKTYRDLEKEPEQPAPSISAPTAAYSSPRYGGEMEATRRAMVEEERISSTEANWHLQQEPSHFVAAASAETIQRMTRGKLTRRETEANQPEDRARLAPRPEFAHSYSFASFEGGAWRGEGAFEAATLTAQLDVGGRLNRAAERPVEFPTSSLPFAPEQAVTR